MKRVSVWYHKDSDFLSISEIPFWLPTYEWLVNRICSCCGITGFLSDKIDWFGSISFLVWSKLLEPIYKLEHELYNIPIESGCKASIAIHGLKHHKFCFSNNCSVEDSEYNMPNL